MKGTTLMLGSLILGLGMTGAAWAQPAPKHDRDAAASSRYSDRNDQWRGDRGDAYRYNSYVYRQGNGDRDDRGAWNNRGRDDGGWRNQARTHNSWYWGNSNMRRGRIDDK
jgi:hypothetical protein